MYTVAGQDALLVVVLLEYGFFYVVVWECGGYVSVEDYPVCGCLFEGVFFWVAHFNGGGGGVCVSLVSGCLSLWLSF